MDLYGLLQDISKIITPQTDSFYEYALHTFDDNGGFLRTRYCWWDRCLENRQVHDHYDCVLLTAARPFDEGSFAPLKHGENTPAKLQLDYGNTNPTFDIEDVIFDIQNRYCYVYLIDVIHKTVQMKHFTDVL